MGFRNGGILVADLPLIACGSFVAGSTTKSHTTVWFADRAVANQTRRLLMFGYH
jgi:hypothetical protein